MGRLWPDTFVEESNLTQNRFVLRRAQHESASYIETVPRRGYRFAGEIRSEPAVGAGVFAVGEVRSGNVKRVASAVAEGSIVASFVHEVLSAS